MNKSVDRPGDSQEDQYGYPYHYLPARTDTGFTQHRYWSWGYRYMGRLQVAFDLMRKLEFRSLLDIGCGDGRFLREARAAYRDKKLEGIDTSAKAVALAEQLNPDLQFKVGDILKLCENSQWDVVTLLDVIEHVPPGSLPEFIAAAVRMLRPGGTLIITTPHLNEKVAAKHYQHFDSAALRAVQPNCMNVLDMLPFDYPSLLLGLVLKLMGGSGRYYVVTYRTLSDFVLRYYLAHCLYGKGERRCRRIACMARKDSTLS